MGLFSKTTASQRDHDELITVQKQVLELQRELDALQRKVDQVDLHARAIVEEAKRLINKFERRLDRETPADHQKGPQNPVGASNGIEPYLGPSSRRNY